MKSESIKCNSSINFFCGDNIEFMNGVADNYYDLAIVDPPYGILSKAGDRLNKYGQDFRNWDKYIPEENYFKELFRVSKEQIIWGGNYFPDLWQINQKSYVFWYKRQPLKDWASGEIAWTSHKDKTAFCFDYAHFGSHGQDPNRFHPTQKPIALYEFCLMTYAKEGNKILDTHGGSMSIAKACHNLGYDLDIVEINQTYYDKGLQQFKEHIQQGRFTFY